MPGLMFSLCVCVQVMLIQPQTPRSLQGSPGPQVDSPSQETMPPPPPPPPKKKEDPEGRRTAAYLKVFSWVQSPPVVRVGPGKDPPKHFSGSGNPTLLSFSRGVSN